MGTDTHVLIDLSNKKKEVNPGFFFDYQVAKGNN